MLALGAPEGWFEGCTDGFAVGTLAGLGDAIDEAGAAVVGGGTGGALALASGVGTETVGNGPEEVGTVAGVAFSDGTGADAISAVPAP
jgi:hypothetical protein